ncbi:hypothetical protein F5X99DRAFT_266004 [Biscogniauxia marginata]|nr:hypothetical protein F5X99DRAFT_266004 [Biscogniauxia marginata]
MNPSSQEALYALLTAYDNSHEPRPLFNDRRNAFALIISFMIFSWLCVILRLYTRFALRCPGIDDLLIVLFRASATVGSVSICLSFTNGFGEHILTIGEANIIAFQKKFYVSLVSYTISTTLMKLTLLTQYLRIFDRGTRERKFVWVMMVISGLWGVAFAFCAAAPCFPVTGFWNWTSPAVCYGFGSKAATEIAGTFIGHGVSNATLDLIVLAIPVPLWKTSDMEHQAGTYPVLDPTWYGPLSIVLGVMEVDLACICASIPVFWPIITQSIGKIFVTQEVHVTHQHRRLSGDYDDHYELQQSITSPSQHSRAGSEASLKLVLTGTKASSQARDHYQDSYIKNSVLPLGMSDKEATSEAQVLSGGPQGFQQKHRGLFGMSKTDKKADTDQDGSLRLTKKISQKMRR